MFQRLFREIHLDRRNLFHAMRFAKPFDVPSRAVKRLPGHSRGLASESLDGFGCRGHFIDRDIIDLAITDGGDIDASVGGVCLRSAEPFFPSDDMKHCVKPLSLEPLSVGYTTK